MNPTAALFDWIPSGSAGQRPHNTNTPPTRPPGPPRPAALHFAIPPTLRLRTFRSLLIGGSVPIQPTPSPYALHTPPTCTEHPAPAARAAPTLPAMQRQRLRLACDKASSARRAGPNPADFPRCPSPSPPAPAQPARPDHPCAWAAAALVQALDDEEAPGRLGPRPSTLPSLPSRFLGALPFTPTHRPDHRPSHPALNPTRTCYVVDIGAAPHLPSALPPCSLPAAGCSVCFNPLLHSPADPQLRPPWGSRPAVAQPPILHRI